MSRPDEFRRSAVERLSALDGRLRATIVPRSLAPERELATPLAEVVSGLAVGEERADLLLPVTEALVTIVEAQLRDFPETVFWDFDFLAARLVALVEPARIAAAAAAIDDLYAGYGRHSEIRFRYGHDFTYGFDWARWVARKPETRASAGPLEPRFLDALRRHRGVLVERIRAGEERYGRLAPSGFRNPYAFSREPEEERVLHERLAETGWIPIEAWSPSGPATWDRPFDDHRAAVAEELGRRRAAG